jgi:hypothetical protein
MIPGIQEIKALAIKYSKKQLANMAQTGLIDPQKAVMAGMMRDRIAKEDMQPPSTTVAQDVLGMGPQAQPQMGMQPQMGQPQGQPQPQMPPPQMGAPMGQPPVMAASGGLTDLPVDVQDYAGGGIVAFDDGGKVPGLFESGFQFPEESFIGKFQRNTLPFQESPAMRNNAELQRIERRLAEPNLSERERQRLKTAQNVLIGATSPTYPSEGSRGAATFIPATAPTTGPSTFAPTIASDTLPPDAPTARRERTGPAPSGPAPTGKSMILEAPTFKPYDMNAVKLKGASMDMPTVDELKDIRATRRAAEKEEGVDPELYNKMIKGVEEKKGKLEGRKGEAAGQALMMAGLGLIGARRGEEFQALGASGQKALTAYKDDMKDLRNASEKYDERMEALRIADQQAKKTNSAADIAKRDAQEARAQAARLEMFKAENELAKTGAQVSATVHATESKRDVDLFQTRQSATTAQEQLKMEKYKADLSARVQGAYTNAVRQGALDERRARTLIEAADSFIKNNVNTPAYLNNPQLLQQDAMAYADKLAGRFMSNTPAARNAPSATPSNRPPLSSFGG